MNRKPPKKVIRTLRTEVGFGCPALGCGNPYLEWHHFDPPWSVEQHHRPEGMIALCVEHHKKADGGAYTIDQLRAMKVNRANAHDVQGRFDWLRNKLLTVVGGCFFYETLRILTIDGIDVVWLRRDEDGYLRLNICMLSLMAQERAIIQDNIWQNIGSPIDLRSPPHGKELTIEYRNGDYLHIRFLVLQTSDEVFIKYPHFKSLEENSLEFPLTVIEVNFRVGGTGINVGPEGSRFSSIFFKPGSGAFHCGSGFEIAVGGTWLQNPSLLPFIPSSRIALCPCGNGKRFKNCHGLLS